MADQSGFSSEGSPWRRCGKCSEPRVSPGSALDRCLYSIAEASELSCNFVSARITSGLYRCNCTKPPTYRGHPSFLPILSGYLAGTAGVVSLSAFN
jgi:hypothetical protein